jgi:hypothetical protein
MSKETIVVDLVKAGESTREEIREAADCTSGSLASYLTGMRNAAKYTGVAICPVEVEDPEDADRKVFVVKTFDEVEEIKAERSVSRPSAASKKTPAERLEAAEKRLTRCESAAEKASDRAANADGNVELDLRADKAEIEVKLAAIELDRAKALVDSADAEAEAPEADEDELM